MKKFFYQNKNVLLLRKKGVDLIVFILLYRISKRVTPLLRFDW